MPWLKTGANHYHVRTFQKKIVQSKGWLSDGRMDALHRNYKRSMFQGAWRGLEPEATPSPLESIRRILIGFQTVGAKLLR